MSKRHILLANFDNAKPIKKRMKEKCTLNASGSQQKVLNVHFPTFLLSALMTSTALAGHEHGADEARGRPPSEGTPVSEKVLFSIKKQGYCMVRQE